MKGTLYTSYFSRFDRGIGHKIVVAKYAPAWLNLDSALHFNVLGPSDILRNNIKNNKITEVEFTVGYLDELRVNNKAKIKLQVIKDLLDNGEDVTIYCYETNDKFCHRNIISNLFSQFGYMTKVI